MRASPFRIRLAALAAATFLFTTPARAQVDTLAFGNQDFGVPVVATVRLDDLAPPYGTVHVAWWSGAKRTLMHATKMPGGWQTESVVDSARTSPDMAVHGDGLPSLAFFDFHGDLIYAERGASSWALDTVATHPGANQIPSLVLGAEPAIAYLAGPSTGPTALNYARRSGTSWTVIELDSLKAVGSGMFWPSLALGPQGQPTVAYQRATSDPSKPLQLIVADGAGPLGPFTSTVVDSEQIGPLALVWDTARNRPMVFYGATTDFGELEYRFAWRDVAGTWEKQTLGTIPEWPQAGLSLALDPVGNVGALWVNFQYIDQSIRDRLESCGGVGTDHLVLSGQPAGVPSAAFTDTEFPTVLHCDQSLGSRAISSYTYGRFEFAWREPRTLGRGTDPHGVFFEELASATTAVPATGPAPSLAHLDLAPNPVTTGATLRVRWSQPRAAETRLEAHDLAGRRVASLGLGRVSAGSAERAWDLRELSPGVYWVSVVLDGRRTAQSVLVRR